LRGLRNYALSAKPELMLPGSCLGLGDRNSVGRGQGQRKFKLRNGSRRPRWQSLKIHFTSRNAVTFDAMGARDGYFSVSHPCQNCGLSIDGSLHVV
jgi:hypothetical protein